MINRRNFLQRITAGAVVVPALLETSTGRAQESRSKEKNTLRFGVCADVHHDLIPDGERRLQKFIEDMNRQKPDFIIQLGDFCQPKAENQSFFSIWKQFDGPRYHVMGNHDTDGGFSKQQVVDYWQMPAPYYSFDKKGYHFIVLDGNELNPSPHRPDGYSRYISHQQRQWLEKDLRTTRLPCIVFCHQGLDNDMDGIEQATMTRTIMERANQEAGFSKVRLVFSGHHHEDYTNEINGILYVQINSMAYCLPGEMPSRVVYSPEIDKRHSIFRIAIPYADPLYATVELSTDGRFSLTGRKSSFVGKSPAEMALPAYKAGYETVAQISARKHQFHAS